MRKHSILILAAAAVFTLSTVGGTLAVARWSNQNESTHVVSTAGVSGKIVEIYEPAENVYPGNATEKVVDVENTGTADCVVRVKVEKQWGEERDEDGDIIEPNDLSTDNILIEFDEEYWYYDEDDGYFYYKGVLAPGEKTEKPLFEEFIIDPTTGPEYGGMTADILVSMECVQAQFHGITMWNHTFEDLGIVYEPQEKENRTAEVEFRNPTEGFIFSPADEGKYIIPVEDLFYNFKNLLPGETVSQSIKVTNSYKPTEIFLRAQDITQSLSPDKVELVNKLLREYVEIVVTDNTGKVLYSGPVWGSPYSDAATPNSMKNNISLGLFGINETKHLNVQLKVDPRMGDEYQELLGLVEWVWSAEGADAPVNPPKTGDTRTLIPYLIGMGLSATALIFLFAAAKKKKKVEVTA